MKRKFPGYYHPSEEQFNKMLKDALIVFDTNILLDLYRVSSDTSKNLMDIIRKLDKRLWIPYQVAFEYHKELFTVINYQIKKYEETSNTIKTIRERMAEKRNHPFLPEDLSEKAMSLFNELESYFQHQQKNLQDIVMEESIKEDLGDLLEGKVGDCFSTKELEDIYAEGVDRYASKIPPGYMDVKNKYGNDVYGDLVIWKEILKKSLESKCDVIIVTDDVKEDWFLQFKGNNCGPHPSLIKEFKDKTNQDVYIYTLDRFLALSEKLKFDVKDETIQEIEQRKADERSQDNMFDNFLSEGKGETMQSMGSEPVQSLSNDYSRVLDELIYKSIISKMGKTKISVATESTESDDNSQVSESSSSCDNSKDRNGSVKTDEDKE